MPVCNDCGNTSAFAHEVHGMEVRTYEGAEHTGTNESDLESRSVHCNQCGSENVTFDVSGSAKSDADPHISLNEPCENCGNNRWTQYAPNDGTDIWYDCLSEGCNRVRFNPGAAAADPAIQTNDFITIGIPGLSRDSLETTLRDHLPGDLADRLAVNPSWQHRDWKKGDPCPYCGHNVINELVVQDERYESADGTYIFMKHGDHTASAGHIICSQCTRPLARTMQPAPQL